VYAVWDDALWVTTARRSVKARAWRADRHVAGLVRTPAGSVVFGGTVRPYDLLDPATWWSSVANAPGITAAALAFTRRNARFFAGYAVDARKVPLAWTPPGRVFARVDVDRAAVVEHGVVRTWGRFDRGLRSHSAFRTPKARRDPLDGVPEEVRGRVGTGGDAALAVDGPRGPLVLPARWALDGGSVHAVVPGTTLRLAGPEADCPAALTVDHASRWRASAMAGVLVQGEGSVFASDRLRSGAPAAAAVAERAGASPKGTAVIRLRVDRVVWWRGWSSGTVRRS